METPQFSNEELEIILLAVGKVDPTGVIRAFSQKHAEAIQTVQRKIQEYISEVQRDQTDAAAKRAVGEN